MVYRMSEPLYPKGGKASYMVEGGFAGYTPEELLVGILRYIEQTDDDPEALDKIEDYAIEEARKRWN